MTTVNSDDKKVLKFEDEKEEDAYQKIKDVFGIDPVRIIPYPLKMEFLSMDIEEQAGVANLFYEYRGEIISYIINCSYQDEMWGIDIEDTLVDQYTYSLATTDVQVQEYELAETGDKKYSAGFDYQDVHYQITGVMERKNMEEILDNLLFLK